MSNNSNRSNVFGLRIGTGSVIARSRQEALEYQLQLGFMVAKYPTEVGTLNTAR